MTPELKPCPFCGVAPSGYLPDSDNWIVTHCAYGCPMFDTIDQRDQWNRRTPDQTEALARLKALEEEMESFSNGYVTAMDRWADEIAAIRKAMGATG